LKERQYDAAEVILGYAAKHHLKSESTRLIAKVNYAQSLRWNGKKEESDAVLESHDWTTCNLLFQICVAAVRDDTDTFKRLLPRVVADGDLKIDEVYEWPAFMLMRKKDEFATWVKDAFGSTLPQELREMRPKLINTRHESTIALIRTILDEAAEQSSVEE